MAKTKPRDYERLNVSIEGEDDDVFWIELSQPGSKNAVDGVMHNELTYVFDEAYESDTRVVVITGDPEAENAFSAGGDIDWMDEAWTEDSDWLPQIQREGEEMIENLVNIEKPVITRVNGDATGYGSMLALYGDIVIMSEEARFGDTHVRMGICPGDGGAMIWPLLTSLNKTKEMLMTGDIISAQEAYEMGLVNHVVPDDQLDEKVNERIDTLTKLPQPAVRYAKMSVNKWLDSKVNEMLRETLALEIISVTTDDHKEMIQAFRENREPHPPSARPKDD